MYINIYTICIHTQTHMTTSRPSAAGVILFKLCCNCSANSGPDAGRTRMRSAGRPYSSHMHATCHTSKQVMAHV